MRLTLHRYKGSVRQCGQAYGDENREMIRAFRNLEIPPDKGLRRFAKTCIRPMRSFTPHAFDFFSGCAQGAGLPMEEMVLLTLHEEVVHTKNCTAVVATGESTRGGKTLMGQNWDWEAKLFPFASMLGLTMRDLPKVLAYSYPGLGTCAGINSAGLGLMWTGGGYFPAVKSRSGVPTYALIFEVLMKRSTQEALTFLKSVPRAGCFLFFLGDRKGDVAVTEGVPAQIGVDRSASLITRANHYLLPDLIRTSRQSIPPPRVYDTKLRLKEIDRLLRGKGRLTMRKIEQALTTPPRLHRHNDNAMTIDTLAADCHEKGLRVARGGMPPGRFTDYAL